MKQRFWIYRRSGVFYLHDAQTGKRESLSTKNKREAEQIRAARSEATENPRAAIAMAKAILSVRDTKILERTWEDVIKEFSGRGKAGTQIFRQQTLRRPRWDAIRHRKLIDTTADDLMAFLKTAGHQAHHFLRCLHNLAVGLGWLPWPILPAKLWPSLKPKPKRAITHQEHLRIVEAERNPELQDYYQMLWETGASQTDAAQLRAENIDWNARVLSYQRCKSGEWAHLRLGRALVQLLTHLPKVGLLFPKVAKQSNSTRSANFCHRCRTAGIKGVSLHSYRYAWAERARACGYEQRWAQNALGHSSSAVHQAYARNGIAVCPSLEDYELAINRNESIPILKQFGLQSSAREAASEIV